MYDINYMNQYKNSQEYFSRYRIPSGCAVFGVMNQAGLVFDGSTAVEGISLMHDRSNGLGGGFAAYGIYPQYRDDWAFHMFYDDILAKRETEDLLEKYFKILFSEEIPTRKVHGVSDPPIIYRYFLKSGNDIFINREGVGIDDGKGRSASGVSHCISGLMEEDFIVDFVMKVNAGVNGAYIISSGKNMGIFKGVGFPEDIGHFFKLETYKGYIWTSHGRFPTNSAGWWGGAHPFGLLDWSVVHNGEISSYGTNKRFASGFGYECTLSTDTEVITYLFDLISRKNGIGMELIHMILAAPFWDEIGMMPADVREAAETFRILYGGALLNGPFSIIVGNSNFMYALNDRIKLRPLVAATKEDFLYVSSEEAPIIKVCPRPGSIWRPGGGEPVMGVLKNTDERIAKNRTPAVI